MSEMAEALELIDDDPEWLRRKLELMTVERDEWMDAHAEVCVENMRLVMALRRLSGGEFGFKARAVASEALRGTRP